MHVRHTHVEIDMHVRAHVKINMHVRAHTWR